MITIESRNVNDALWAGASMLRQMGVQRDSRKKGGRQDLEKALSYCLKLLAVPGLVPARERLGYSPAKLARYLRASGLEDTAEAALTVAIDSWRTDNDLRQLVADLEALIHATGG